MMNVIIYTITPCPYCERAKRFFKDKSIPVEEINLTGQYDQMLELKNRTQHSTFPQIFINDKFIGGYSDLVDQVNEGKIKL